MQSTLERPFLRISQDMIVHTNGVHVETAVSRTTLKQHVRNIPVCLIIPPSTFLADERVFPFLAPLYISAELENNGNPVEMLDLSGYENYIDIITTYVKDTNIKVFGLTATTPQIPATAKIVQAIRGQIPDATIILGGPHATLVHTAMENDEGNGIDGRGTQAFRQIEQLFDKVVVGDGEEAVFNAIDPENHERVILANKRSSELFLKKGSLDKYQWPSRHMIDLKRYKYEIDGHLATTLIHQRGCPYGCLFCGGRLSEVYRMARTRDAKRTVAEMENIYNTYGFRAFMFFDDELNAIPDNAESLCREVINLQEKLGVSMSFRAFVKAERFTAPLAKLMYQAGFRMLLSGVESGSEEILYTMRKNTTPEDNYRCVAITQDAGMDFKALMSYGHAGDSHRTIDQSEYWVRKARPNQLDITIITQYPGSPYFDYSVYDSEKDAWVFVDERTGNRLYSRALDYTKQADYYKGTPGDYIAYVWTDYLSSEELVQRRDIAETELRVELGLPPIVAVAGTTYCHTPGEPLPSHILRRSLPLAA